MFKSFAKSLYAFLPFKPAIMHAVRSVWQPPEKIYRHLHFKGPITLDLPNGANMRINHFGNQVENDLFWSGFGNGWENASLITWLWIVRDANVVLDIGANTGVYGLSAQATRPNAKVLAFEAVERIHKKLASNFALNDYPENAKNIALSDKNGSVALYDPGGEHAYSASLNSDMIAGSSSPRNVEARKLDDLIDEFGLGKVDVMKIDVEMHEPEVIAGASHCLSKDYPAMLIEILNKQIGDSLVAALSDYVFYEIGDQLVKTDAPGSNADRNYLVLGKDDPRVQKLGDATDVALIRSWI